MEVEKVRKKPDCSTSAKRKQYVERAFREAGKNLGEFGKTEFFNAEQRKTALLETIDRARDEFSSLWLYSLEESLTQFEIACYHNFLNADEYYSLTLGATIWMLDELRRGGKLADAYEYLPASDKEIEEVYLPMDFYHPCYDEDLIRSVLYVILPKNVLNATRKQYIGLIRLLERDKIDSAVDTFKTLQWKATELFLKCEEFFDLTNDKMLREMESVLSEISDTPNERVRELTGKGAELLENRRKLMAEFEDHIGTTERRVLGFRELGRILRGFSVENPYEICFASNYLVIRQDKAAWSVKSGIAVASAAGRMLPWYVSDKEWNEDLLEPIPFDLKNNWLEQSDSAADLQRMYALGKDGKNMAQHVYRLCRGMMPVGFHPFEDERKRMKAEGREDADQIADQAEILFLSSFMATPDSFRDGLWWEEENGSSSPDEQKELKEQAETATSPVIIREMEDAQEQPVVKEPEPIEQSTESQDNNTEELLEKAKKEIKNLKSVLAGVSREADADRARAEHELKTLRMEHRELADLRTLLFNREAESPERLEKVEKKISYPYETRKRTVVFGGHDSFLRAFKPLLPDVKYIETEKYGFAPEIIRNADVVWIQTNCISHSQYSNITKLARQHGIQLRYFGFASAEKCAEQLVTEDQR